jgi:SdrD B-like domain
MSTVNSNPFTYGGLSFTNIVLNETDNGSVSPLTDSTNPPMGVSTSLGAGIAWSGYSAGAYYANSSEVLNFSYSVSTTSSASLIDTASELYVLDQLSGPGVSLTAVENIYSTSGTLLGTETFVAGQAASAPVTLSQAEQTINVQVTVTMSVSPAGTSNSIVLDSQFEQSFGTVAAPPATASIGTTVWMDTNQDGLDDNGEQGVAGVTVDLLSGTGSFIECTTTDASGLYQFTNLDAGTYQVQVIVPTGDGVTTQSVSPGATGDLNSVINGSGLTSVITLTTGEIDNNVNAGLTPPPAALGDYVWLDANRNGLQDSNETGVAGVTVDLLNATGTSILATTTTNSSGAYSFAHLNPGTYEVQFLAPTGDTFTTQGVGSNSAIDSNANQTTGVTEPVTLTAGQTDNTIDAGLQIAPAALGDYVWLDANRNGLQDSNETGVAGVTVDLLNATGTSILATTTTNSGGAYSFANLNPGTYEVKFLAPTGDIFTTQGAGSNTAIDSNANQTTGVTAPVTLTAGQTNNTIDAGLQSSSGLTVLKQPSSMVVNQCGQVTYTFTVTNTGSTALTNIKIGDNIGTAANPDYVVPTLVTKGTNGTLAAGASWTYTETVNQISCTSGSAGSVGHTVTGSHLTSGCTAWLSSSFNPTSCANGATYKFQGVSCEISGGGVGSKPISVDCPDSVVTFSSSCKSATTVFNASTDCWVTTLPANSNPGSVFLTGVPLTVPNGCNLSNASVTWSIDDSSNNCGASKLTWDADCAGYSNFNQNGCNGTADYNQIGVKSCDNSGSYGNGGSCDIGYGYNGSSYGGGGYGGGNNGSGWQGSSSDCAGTPENQYTGNNCGSSGNNGYGSSNGYGGNNNGYGGSNGYGGNDNGCSGGSNNNDGSCGGSGSATQSQGSVVGAADTVTVTATAPGNTTVSASDTKEVEVLASNCNVSVDGSATTSSLSKVYGTAETLEFTYSPGNTVSLKQVQSGLATVSGTNSASMAFIEITNNSSPFASNASIYFEGSVTSGEKIYADATTNVLTNTPISGGHFSTTAGADMFAYVFVSQAAFKAGAAPVQTMAYNTSGSQAMHIGDTIGSLSVVGYVGATGGHLAS